jgi:tetratricopeptide (TPR) repeat protein
MWLAEASRIFPTLKAIYPGIPQPTPTLPEAIRLRLADALFHMLSAIRENGPAALIFDDTHHMDLASRHVLFVLEQRLSETPVALFGTVRCETSERDGSSSDLFRWTVSRRLEPLTEEHALGLVHRLSRTVPASETASIVELSEGNPHFIEMLVQDWEDHQAASLAGGGWSGDGEPRDWEPPSTLRSAFARLYEDLGSVPRQILHMLAVGRRAFELEELAAILSGGGDQIAEHVVELFNRGIVRFDASAVCFKNELHRAFVYYSMPHDVRKYRHRQIANVLRSEVDPVPLQDALEVGYHLLRGGLTDSASQLLLFGAEHAINCGAPSEAERALLSMGDEADRATSAAHRITLARAQFAQGKHGAALGTLEPLRATRDLTAAASFAESEIIRARASIASGLLNDAMLEEAASTALSAAIESQREDVLVEALQVAGEIAGELGNLDRLSELMARCRQAMETISGEFSRGVALSAVGYSHLITGDARAALEAFDESTEALGGDNVSPAALRALNGAGIACVSLADRGGATDRLSRALEHARHLGDAGAEAVLNRNLAALKMEFGEFVEAADHFERALSRYSRQPTARYGCTIYGAAASFSMDIGAFDQADQLIRKGELCAKASPVARDVVDLVLLRADFHIAIGEPEHAWELLEQHVLRAGTKTYLVGEAAPY